jgi:hypothetical protein
MFDGQISHSTLVNCLDRQFQDTLPLQSQISDSLIWSLNLSKPCIVSFKLAIMELGPWCSIVLSNPSLVELEVEHPSNGPKPVELSEQD